MITFLEPEAEAVDGHDEEDDVEEGDEADALDGVEPDADDIDDDPVVPAFEAALGHEEHGGEAHDGGEGVDKGVGGGVGEEGGEEEVEAADEEGEEDGAEGGDGEPAEEGAGLAEADVEFVGLGRFLAFVPSPPAIDASAEVVDLFGGIGVEADLVEEEHVEDDGDDANGPSEDVVFGDEPDGPEIEDGADEFDVAHGVVEDGEEDGVDAE